MTEKERWSSLILEWEQSGLHQMEFCKSKGLNFRDFKHWRAQGLSSGEFTHMHRHQIAEKKSNVEKADTPNTFSPIEVVANSQSAPTPTNMLELHLPRGIVLKLPI